MTPLPVTFSVVPTATERLDRFLADQLQLSRTQAARLVAGGNVRIAGTAARASRVLARGEEVAVTFPADLPMRELTPHDIPLDIVHEDEHLLVIDKPAGLVVHPAPGHWDDTLVNALVARGTALGGGTEGRPGIVHRLDRDTSGLLVVARTDLAHRRLAAMIAARKVRRIYAALAWGHLSEDRTVMEAPIGRHPADRKRMAVRAEGRAARTDAMVAARLGPCDLLRLELHSGRTHQIRVHLEMIGHPVVGDPVYAGGGARRISGHGMAVARRLEALAPRQALHATVLAFRHPISGEPLVLHAPWPADLWPLLTSAAGADPLPERVELLRSLGFLAPRD
jgi:23S rRNA pseudouridine1911/1915/1917 synthase